jgi:hypothetical protein
MKSLLDPSFRYTPSIRTDIRKTFARIRKEAQVRQDGARQSRDEAARKVAVLFPEQKAASRM